MKTIETVAQFELALAKHCSGFGEHPAKDIPLELRYSKLTAEQIRTLSDFAAKNAETYIIPKPTLEILFAIGGLVETQTEQPFITVEGKNYVATRNKFNRPRTKSRIGPVKTHGTYANMMVRGLWAINLQDPWVIDVTAQAISLQHRLDAEIQAIIAGAELPPIVIVLGLPRQFKDLADKSKSRSKIDDSFTDATLFPDSLVQYVELSVSGETTAPKQQETRRKDLVKLRSTVCGMLSQRLQGKDISSTGAKQDFDEESSIAERFGTITLPEMKLGAGETETIIEGGSFLALDWLCCRVYESGKSGEGKQGKSHLALFANSIIATALALGSNDETYISEQVAQRLAENEVESETIEEKAERQLAYREEILAQGLRIDIDMVEHVLGLLTSTVIELRDGKPQTTGGPLGSMLAKLAEFNSTWKSLDTKHVYKPTSVPAMSAMVQLIRSCMSSELEAEIYTRYKSRDGKYSEEYRNFGGADVGFIKKERASKE